VDALLGVGAKLDEKNAKGETALQVAFSEPQSKAIFQDLSTFGEFPLIGCKNGLAAPRTGVG
jgi:hypothetical protein